MSKDKKNIKTLTIKGKPKGEKSVRGRRITDAKKAAIFAALLQGQSVAFVAEEQGVAPSTVSKYRGMLAQFEQKKDVTELVMEVLKENLIALKTITQEVSRPEFIKEQDLSDIAVFYGVVSDKSFRILSALSPQE